MAPRSNTSARSRLTSVMERFDGPPSRAASRATGAKRTKKKASPAKKKTTPAKKKATTPVKKKKTTPATTPPAKAKRQQQGDKYELSPTGRAKCTTCRNIIHKGEKRVGKEVYEARYGDYTHRYYHDLCYPASQKAALTFKNAGATPEDELARAVKVQCTQKAMITGARRELFEALKTLRYGFGQKLNCDDNLTKIFSNKTLEEMTAKMPMNQTDMIANVYGMGPKKYESFGAAFLQVIQQYSRKYNRAVQTQATESRITRSSTAGGASSAVTSKSSKGFSTRSAVATAAGGGTATTQIVIIDSDDDDDDDDDGVGVGIMDSVDDDVNDDEGVEALESLSCTEIIQRKFEHAATNGYVISLD
jgi:hypothetical protein